MYLCLNKLTSMEKTFALFYFIHCIKLEDVIIFPFICSLFPFLFLSNAMNFFIHSSNRFMSRINSFQNQNTYERNFNLIINENCVSNKKHENKHINWSNMDNSVVKTCSQKLICECNLSLLNAFARAIARLYWKGLDSRLYLPNYLVIKSADSAYRLVAFL